MEPVDKRQIGPVTTAATGGVALSGVVCWLSEQITQTEIPDNIELYVAILFTIAAGYLVKPKAKRAAE